jgi:hypothetical protein
MISDIEPIPHMSAISVNGEGFPFKGIENHKGDQLFWELIGAIVIGAIRYRDRQAISLVIGPDQMVRTGF